MVIQRALSLSCICCAALLLAGCGGGEESPTSPTETVANVAGTWDVAFDGTIVQRNDGGALGDPQRDRFVFSLQQSGASVTGEMILNEGRSGESRMPLTGTLTASRFDYRVDFSLGSGCSLSIRAETTIDGAAATFAGTQTQSNCEGRAEGRVNGTKR